MDPDAGRDLTVEEIFASQPSYWGDDIHTIRDDSGSDDDQIPSDRDGDWVIEYFFDYYMKFSN